MGKLSMGNTRLKSVFSLLGSLNMGMMTGKLLLCAEFNKISKRFLFVNIVIAFMPVLLMIVVASAGVPENVNTEISKDIASRIKDIDADLYITFTGNTNGYLQSCGCTANQSGGLAKRATLISLIQKEVLQRNSIPLLIDLGNLADSEDKSLVVLQSMKVSGYDCSFKGSMEEKSEGIKEYADAQGIDVIGINKKSKILKNDVLIVDYPRSKKEWNDWFLVKKEGNPYIVMISALSYNHVRGDLKNIPRDRWPSCIIFSENEVNKMLYIEGIPCFSGIDKQSVGLIAINKKKTDKSKIFNFDIKFELKENPEVLQLVANYFSRQAGLLSQKISNLSADWDKYKVDSPGRCGECHAQAYQAWEKSKHSHSLMTLERKNRLVPECLRCHSEIFRKNSVYKIAEGFHDGVTCTTCHDDGVLHIASRDRDQITRSKGKAFCVACHDTENDPKFDYGSYLEKIKHWKIK